MSNVKCYRLKDKELQDVLDELPCYCDETFSFALQEAVRESIAERNANNIVINFGHYTNVVDEKGNHKKEFFNNCIIR